MHLELRDKYFSQVKQSIEDVVKNYNSPVVLIAHSMGNRIVQYFLQWVSHEPNGSTDWIKHHIETFLAISAPWLGSPKSLRSVVFIFEISFLIHVV